MTENFPDWRMTSICRLTSHQVSSKIVKLHNTKVKEYLFESQKSDSDLQQTFLQQQESPEENGMSTNCWRNRTANTEFCTWHYSWVNSKEKKRLKRFEIYHHRPLLKELQNMCFRTKERNLGGRKRAKDEIELPLKDFLGSRFEFFVTSTVCKIQHPQFQSPSQGQGNTGHPRAFKAQSPFSLVLFLKSQSRVALHSSFTTPRHSFLEKTWLRNIPYTFEPTQQFRSAPDST